MKVRFPLFVSVLVLFFPQSTRRSQSPKMGVVIQSTEDNSDKPTITVHLLNITDKEVTAFNLSVQQTLPDGKTLKPSAHTEDMLGAYLLHGKAFSPNSTVDVQMGKILVQIPKPVDETMVVDVVIYADGTAQVQNQDRFKDIMDQRTAPFQTPPELLAKALQSAPAYCRGTLTGVVVFGQEQCLESQARVVSAHYRVVRLRQCSSNSPLHQPAR